MPQDDAEAVRWWRRAAEQGHATAQYNLGVMYANGRGVPQDDAEAVRWYRLAADQGEALAQSNLGVMYANGRGVPQDDVHAHMWINLGASRMTAGEEPGANSQEARRPCKFNDPRPTRRSPTPRSRMGRRAPA